MFVDLHKFAPANRFSWWEAAKSKTMYGKARKDERHHEGRRTWNHRDLELSIKRSTYECEAWIGNARSASIRHNSNGFILLQQLFDMLTSSLFIMFMEGYLWFVNPEMFEQKPCFARIFSRDKVDFTQYLKSA